MKDFPLKSGLYTDFYELTMAQGYFLNGWQSKRATFDYFFRKTPFGGGYVLFAGLDDLLSVLENLSFDKDDCDHLIKLGFNKEFVKYLRDFRFAGNIDAVREGEVVFPNEPVLIVEGGIIESQIIETVVLNLLNFQSLIATKASRIRQSAGDRIIVDFGLRRAQGLGGLHGSRAAVLGGVNSTSNTYSARTYGLEASGTQAHSWIESFEDELMAFRSFAKAYPESCVLLVDTYNTLRSGVPNAITVAKEMQARGEQLAGIRLDSGDLSYLSKKARGMLDRAGLENVKIAVSNQLDEHIIKSLLEQDSPIDMFGVGTSLATGKDDAALDGVYKLSSFEGAPRLKISDNIEKTLLPGSKAVHRYLEEDQSFFADGIFVDGESADQIIYHPSQSGKQMDPSRKQSEPLLFQQLREGSRVNSPPEIYSVQDFAMNRLGQLPDEHKRFANPHVYKVGISNKLMKLRNDMIANLRSKYPV